MQTDACVLCGYWRCRCGQTGTSAAAGWRTALDDQERDEMREKVRRANTGNGGRR